MKIKVQFNTENAIFQDDFNQEITNVFLMCTMKTIKANETLRADDAKNILDSNGNEIGTIFFNR